MLAMSRFQAFEACLITPACCETGQDQNRLGCESYFSENDADCEPSPDMLASDGGLSWHVRMVIFGGCNQEGKRLSEVHTLDLSSWEWQKQTTEEQVPNLVGTPSAWWHARGAHLLFGFAPRNRTCLWIAQNRSICSKGIVQSGTDRHRNLLLGQRFAAEDRKPSGWPEQGAATVAGPVQASGCGCVLPRRRAQHGRVWRQGRRHALCRPVHAASGDLALDAASHRVHGSSPLPLARGLHARHAALCYRQSAKPCKAALTAYCTSLNV